jgi:hypothetical protein
LLDRFAVKVRSPTAPDNVERVMSTHVRNVMLFAGLVSLAGCGDGGSGTGPPPTVTGTVSAQLTDAPLPIDSVERVDVHIVRLDATMGNPSDAAVRDPSSGISHPQFGWATIATPNKSYNLLELRNGATTTLGEGDIPIGTYRRFRLVLDTDKSTVTLRGGKLLSATSTPGIRWPSAGQTGVKVDMNGIFELTRAGSGLVIDFNLEDSFEVAGSSVSAGGLIFNPVIRVKGR